MHKETLIKYFGLTLASWCLYLASVFVLASYLFQQSSFAEKSALASAPYYGVAIPSGPANLGVFSRVTDGFTEFMQLPLNQSLAFNLVAWAILLIPISLIGLVLLFVKTRESLWQTRPKQASEHSLMNKLYRNEDISKEMASFLENYFSGNTLSRIVHRLELKNEFRLLRYFKGGSDAITILVSQDGQQVVKKIIPPEFEDRLKAQYDWLEKRKGKEGIVQTLGEKRARDHYSIDLAYRSDDEMFFDFMHRNPIANSTAILDQVWGYLFKSVHNHTKKVASHPKERDTYIKKHVYGCLEKAASVDAELLRAAESETIVINGKTYDNLYQILDKIKQHPQAWADLATYQAGTAVHGDVAVDNILVSKSTGDALLIDPAPDGNIIEGPVFDFGKNMQSLYCGYEFLLRDEDPVFLEEGNQINYRDHKSGKYSQLCKYVRKTLAPRHLTEAEQRSMLFHAGALHIRRLKHQVYYNPANVLKFYAVGVKTFNDFLDQYD